jgi:metal-responsive CopG/Arc/MetJ family transcriptional regulator
MKVALSIPDDLFETAETLSKRLGVSRSRLYASALADFLAKHRGGKVTQHLNSVYATQESRLEPGVRRLQRRSLERNAW